MRNTLVSRKLFNGIEEIRQKTGKTQKASKENNIRVGFSASRAVKKSRVWFYQRGTFILQLDTFWFVSTENEEESLLQNYKVYVRTTLFKSVVGHSVQVLNMNNYIWLAIIYLICLTITWKIITFFMVWKFFFK